eukprot:jgi/Botrbrau1/439/Bobra.110_2s0088.1
MLRQQLMLIRFTLLLLTSSVARSDRKSDFMVLRAQDEFREQTKAFTEEASAPAEEPVAVVGCQSAAVAAAGGPDIAPAADPRDRVQLSPCSDTPVSSTNPTSTTGPPPTIPQEDPDFFPRGLPRGPAPLPKPTEGQQTATYEGPPVEEIGKPTPDLYTSRNIIWGGELGDLGTPSKEPLQQGDMEGECFPPDPISDTVSFPKYAASPYSALCEDSFREAPTLPVPNVDTILQDTRWDVVGPVDLPLYADFNNLLRSFRGSVRRKDGAFSKDEEVQKVLAAIVAVVSDAWVPSKRGAAAVNGTGFSTSDDPINRASGMAREESNTTIYDVVTVTPGTVYTFTFMGSSKGSSTAGVAFYSSSWRLLSLPYFQIDSDTATSYNMSVVAPPETQKAIVFASIAPNNDAGSEGARFMTVRAVQYGPAVVGGLAIDYKGVVKTLSPLCLGINTNYLMDDRNRRNQAYPYEQALRDLGVGALRYPGGEKSDGVFWAGRDTGTIPNPMPSRWQYGQNGRYDWPVGDRLFFDYNNYQWTVPVMRFDEFLSVATNVAAEIYCVLNYDSANFQTGYSASLKSLKIAAMNWISYAARQAKRVRFWEFSNESFFKSYNGYAKAATYATDLVDWVTALKRIDPSAKFGAIGPANRYGVGEVDCCGTQWWPTILPRVAPLVDFVICHSYPISAWSFATYYQNTQNFQNDVQEIDAALYLWAPTADRDRLRISVTETAAYDWNFNGYHWNNGKADLGHALVTVDLLASQLAYYKTDYVFFWNTRWRTSYNEESTAPGSVVDAFWDNNGLTAVGNAIRVVNFFKGATVLWSSSTQTVRCWGLIPPRGSNWALTLMLLNKAPSASSQQVTLYNYSGNKVGTAYQFGGTTDTDINPPYVKLSSRPTIVNTTLSIQLAPVSVTIIVF